MLFLRPKWIVGVLGCANSKNSLIKESSIASKQAGERGAVSARSVRKVREGCLRKFKG